jgi:hypothetical protein
VLEGSKAIKDEGLGGCLLGTTLLVKQKTVASEAIGQASYCCVGDTCLSSNLAKSRARNQTVEDGFEEVASSEPVVSGKRL